jgi:hypothetical protein
MEGQHAMPGHLVLASDRDFVMSGRVPDVQMADVAEIDSCQAGNVCEIWLAECLILMIAYRPCQSSRSGYYHTYSLRVELSGDLGNFLESGCKACWKCRHEGIYHEIKLVMHNVSKLWKRLEAAKST